MHKLYTKSHDLNELQAIDNNGEIFTSSQHACISETHHKDVHKNYDTIIRYFFSQRSNKLKDIDLIKGLIGHNKVNILSLGAGDCTLEHYLEFALPQNSKLTATDFDSYLIDNATKHFKNIQCETFDFFSDKICNLNQNFDTAYFLASSYVMSDEQYLRLFKDLRDNGVKKIIDICGGVRTFDQTVQHFVPSRIIKRNKLIRRIMNKPTIENMFKGKFHGYARTKSELRKIYKQTNPKKITEISHLSHKYIAILEF